MSWREWGVLHSRRFVLRPLRKANRVFAGVAAQVSPGETGKENHRGGSGTAVCGVVIVKTMPLFQRQSIESEAGCCC